MLRCKIYKMVYRRSCSVVPMYVVLLLEQSKGENNALTVKKMRAQAQDNVLCGTHRMYWRGNGRVGCPTSNILLAANNFPLVVKYRLTCAQQVVLDYHSSEKWEAIDL